MLPSASTPPDFITFAARWSSLMARGDFQAACDLIDEPRDDGTRWTPELLRHTVEVDTFGPGTRFRTLHPEGVVYSDPAELPPQRPDRLEVAPLKDNAGYWLDWDLPLNGEWSDLTAQFEFLRTGGGFRVRLTDLHVM